MLKPRLFVIAGLLLAVLVLGIGLTRLLTLRYQHGDVYPPYSTLRSDPLGAKAIHDALSEMDGFEVARNFLPLEKAPVNRPATWIYAGVPRQALWRKPELAHARALLTNGSRLVFAFTPENWSRRIYYGPPAPAPGVAPPPSPAPAPSAPPSEDPKADEPPEEVFPPILDRDGVPFREVMESWGAAFAVRNDTKKTTFTATATATEEAAALGLEPGLSWHSALYFKNLAPAWRVLYRCEDMPVIVERTLGEGAVVLIADAFFLSNEALRGERRPALLEWTAGPLPRLIFDEEHFGIAESMNLAGLARKYRLGGVVAVLALVAAMVLWKNAAPLVPRRAGDADGAGEVRGKDAEEGLVKLLRRNIPPREVLAVCAGAWEKSAPRGAPGEHRAHLDSVLRGHGARGRRDIARDYRTIAEGLSRKPPPENP